MVEIWRVVGTHGLPEEDDLPVLSVVSGGMPEVRKRLRVWREDIYWAPISELVKLGTIPPPPTITIEISRDIAMAARRELVNREEGIGVQRLMYLVGKALEAKDH